MDVQTAVLEAPQASPEGKSEFELDVIAGLSGETKSLPPKYFYDTAGSALFERITDLPEYYVTRSEVSILNRHGISISCLFPASCALIEFGAGSSRKSRILLRATATIETYVPIDISGDFLQKEVADLRRDFPHLAVCPLVCDFTKPFRLPKAASSSPRVGFFPGSTIGNLEPYEARDFLEHIGAVLGKEATLVIGIDLVKDRRTLANAYDDARGVTAKFNLNLLKRINRELDGNFYLHKFRHLAFYNPRECLVEMHLVSKCRQEVQVAGHVFQFDADESIHTESSYKYTVESFRDLARQSGWSAIGMWTDGLYSVHALASR